jgi:hypothetical protein
MPFGLLQDSLQGFLSRIISKMLHTRMLISKKWRNLENLKKTWEEEVVGADKVVAEELRSLKKLVERHGGVNLVWFSSASGPRCYQAEG